MRTKILIVLFTVAAAMNTAGCGQKQISYSKHVQPILEDHCLECHDGIGEGSEKTELLVTDYASIMKGTSAGPVITPGSSVSSTFYRVISHQTSTKIQMPPHHDTSLAHGRGEPLSEEDISMIGAWIDQGALNN